MLESAIDSSTQSLQDWNDRVYDTKEKWIDRIIVYGMIGQESFSDTDLLALIKTHQLDIDNSELDKALARLRIGFIIKHGADGRYRFRVPLFKAFMLERDVKSRFASEVSKFSR